MSWEPEIDELEHRQELAARMGGEERVARNTTPGGSPSASASSSFWIAAASARLARSPAKENMIRGALEEFTPANCIFGRGSWDAARWSSRRRFHRARRIADASIWDKFKMAEIMAREYRMPLIRLIEGSGGGGSVRSIEKTGFANLPGGLGGQSGGLHLCCATMAAVPVVALGLGPVAGLGAAKLCVSHLSIMVKDQSQVFVAGRPWWPGW